MKRINICAHRGYSDKYPENTMLAFRKAFECGADSVECDLQKTKDGCYVIIHDSAVNRTAVNRKGDVADMTLADLKTCDLGDKQTIAELAEFLAIIPPDRLLDLELKKQTISADDCPRIYSVLMQYISPDRLMISSTMPDLLVFFRAMHITTGFILDEESKTIGIPGVLKLIISTRPSYLNLPVRMFSEIGNVRSWLFIMLVKLLGRKIAFWTINTDAEFKKIKHVSRMIITDRVEYLLSLPEIRKSRKPGKCSF